MAHGQIGGEAHIVRRAGRVFDRVGANHTDKLDAVCARIDACREQLGRVPALLKKFREAVLEAAVSGRLTEEWRESYVSVPRSVAEVLSARHALWTQQPVDRRANYKPPFPPAVDHGLETPGGWQVVTASTLALLQVGFAFKSAMFRSSGIRLLRGENVEPGKLRWKEVRCWNPAQVAGFERLLLSEGDLILAMDRPIVSAGLKLARVKSSDLPALLVQRVMRFICTTGDDLDYLEICLRSRRFVEFLADKGMTGSDLPHITGTGVAKFPIPLRPRKNRERSSDGFMNCLHWRMGWSRSIGRLRSARRS